MTKTIIGMRLGGGVAERVALDALNLGDSIRREIDCRSFDVVGLRGHLDLFVDDEGAINGSELNLPLTKTAHMLGTPTVLYGAGVFVGIDKTDGSSVSLTETQFAILRDAMQTRPSFELLNKLAASLAPLGAALDRSLTTHLA
ncbi:MAG: DUF3846 domain-containing protein [Microbacteriaceae bacterium]|nr:DUF3846 domain-containing protein [Microbacteriaceae bacterium]